MRALFARLERIAPTEANILITGETGTGKELVAEAIHRNSPRASGPFVVVDCGSLPDNLIGSELFGHERGAFTGAVTTYQGAFERASGGTVFLDELGELPLDLQTNLLGVLERRHIRRLGGKQPIGVDIRVIAATNRDLGVEINRGRFREDLYYRLAVVEAQVPPLRERSEDIALLATHFLRLFSGDENASLSERVLGKLKKHPFPGNVRELRNLMERSVVLSEGGLDATPPLLAAGGGATSEPHVSDDHFDVDVDEQTPYKVARDQLLRQFEVRYLRKLLKRHGGNISKAARAARIDRMTIHNMMQRTGLTRDDQ